MAATALVRAVLGALVFLASGDIISPPHVQTAGVLTCRELGGVCRVPPEAAEEDGEACREGEELREYDLRCDSGCGYWRGHCGQPCCMPSSAKAGSAKADASHQQLEEKASVGVATLGVRGGAGEAPPWADFLALGGVACLVLALYRWTYAQERRQVSLLQHPVSGEVE